MSLPRWTGMIAALLLSQPLQAGEETAKKPGAEPPKPWCAPAIERLAGGVCHHQHSFAEGKPRTLVIFLHGLVQEGAGWQHNQQRGLVRGARRLGFSMLSPRGQLGANRRGADLVAWPTGRTARKKYEAALLAQIDEARSFIEQRDGAFDEVFVVGFSNGAHYAASLAMRAGLKVDGYAVFAGGSPYSPAVASNKRAPVFVGVCGKDNSAKDARSLAASLSKAGWPHQAETRRVGHAIADRHLDNALAYLRKMRQAKPRPPGDG